MSLVITLLVAIIKRLSRCHFSFPFPFSYFGTMGAFIQLKEPPKNRRILLDIGIAGPLAGLIVAIPVLLLGLYLSPVDKIPFQLPVGQIFEGNSILYLLLKFIVKGQLLPQPFTFAGSESHHLLDPLFLHRRTSPRRWFGCELASHRLGRLGGLAGHLPQSDPCWAVGWWSYHVRFVG